MYDIQLYIDISNKGLVTFSDLSMFAKLEILFYENNKLPSLHQLNKNLKELVCSHNQLISLFPLDCKDDIDITRRKTKILLLILNIYIIL